MQQEAKLVIAQQLDGQKRQFLIFNNQIVGEGGFGVVKKAIRNDRPHQILVSKIIPYDDETKRQKIQKQLEIIRKLPAHENLVTVHPSKCYSAKNYYIFMQYCPDGTLEDKIQKQKNFTQTEIFQIFYQLMRGYKVLWESKILHQDLKPDNVLIKNGRYKLTDFGFSIIHEGFKYGNIREGTLPYMPLEKLTQKQYYASTKSDVYSFGIILFRLITGHHPYVISKGRCHRQYLRELKMRQLQLRPNFSSRFTLKFQHFFDLVLAMIAKDQKSRIDFDKIYSYIQQQEIFDKIHNSLLNHQQKQINNQYKKFAIVGESEAIEIPFSIPEHQQKKYRSQMQIKYKNKEQEENQKILQQMQNHIISQRIIVYFFDRLTRRIYVEKMKHLEKSPEQVVLSEKIILCVLLLCKKIIQGLLKQCKTGVLFPLQKWKIYRKQNTNLLKLIEKDQNYLEDLVIDCLSQSSQTKIIERKAMLDKSKGDFQNYKQYVLQLFKQCLNQKISLMKPDQKNILITICYILSGISILSDLPKWEKQALQLQLYFRKVETQDCEVLFSRILQQLQQKQISFTLDLGIVE